MKKYLMILLLLLVGCSKETNVDDLENQEVLLGINYDISSNISEFNYESMNPIVSLYIEEYGSVVLELYPEKAPNTVANFVELVEEGFYNGNTFHRLVNDFVLQGGDPNGVGSGGPGYSIKGEFSLNGFENDLKHEKWVLSMARSSDLDSAGSQFFIMLDEALYLDGSYAAFGKVIDGFDNIEKMILNEEISYNGETLKENLIIKKALVDYNSYIKPEVIKIER